MRTNTGVFPRSELLQLLGEGSLRDGVGDIGGEDVVGDGVEGGGRRLMFGDKDEGRAVVL